MIAATGGPSPRPAGWSGCWWSARPASWPTRVTRVTRSGPRCGGPWGTAGGGRGG